jgi:hypothetical protein
MSDIMQLVVKTDGSVCCVYAEELDLRALGLLTIRRASHVEPDSCGQWVADLSPVGGSVLGPFSTRSQALDAEQNWLNAHWLTASV